MRRCKRKLQTEEFVLQYSFWCSENLCWVQTWHTRCTYREWLCLRQRLAGLGPPTLFPLHCVCSFPPFFSFTYHIHFHCSFFSSRLFLPFDPVCFLLFRSLYKVPFYPFCFIHSVIFISFLFHHFILSSFCSSTSCPSFIFYPLFHVCVSFSLSSFISTFLFCFCLFHILCLTFAFSRASHSLIFPSLLVLSFDSFSVFV